MPFSPAGATDDGLVGRAAELSAAGEFLDLIPAGAASLTLEGEAGIGKSMLWETVGQRAEARGWVVLRSRASQSEARVSFVGLCDLFAPVRDDVLAQLPEPQHVALLAALARGGSSSGLIDQRTLGLAVLSLVRELAQSASVLVAVDDVQWLDAASASLLRFAFRRLRDEPVGLLVAVRPGATGTDAVELAVAGERNRTLPVGPMSVAALQVMLRDRFGQSFPRPTMLQIADVSGGNPFFASEIARELLRVGAVAPGGALPVPADLRALVAARLRRLPAGTRDELLAVAALAGPSIRLLDESLLAPAEEAEVVRVGPDGRIAFTHPLLAAAVYSSASGPRRRLVHGRLAAVVEDAEERAWHRALAATSPDETVAEALEEGAARARARGGWISAAEMMERAVELTPGGDSALRLRRGVRGALYRMQAGDREGARVVLERLLEVAPAGPLRGDVRRLLAEIQYSDGSFGESARLFEEALEETDDPKLAGIAELGLAYVKVTMLDLPAAARHARRAAELGAEAGLDGAVAEALAAGAVVGVLRGRGVDREALERAVRLEDPDRVVPLQARPKSLAAIALLFDDRLSEAREALVDVWQGARERGEESDLALMLSWFVWLETLSGSYGRAAEIAEEGLLLTDMTAHASGRCWVLTQRCLLRAHVGLVDECRADGAQAAELAERVGLAVALPWLAAGRCLLELSVGDAGAAWAAAEPLARLVEALGVGEPTLALFVPDAAEALLELGETDRAEGLVASFEAAAVRLRRSWAVGAAARCRGLVLAARDDHDGAEAALREALDVQSRGGRPFELARTQLALGRLQRRRNQRKAARETLAQASSAFTALGAHRFAEIANSESARIGVRRAPDELTTGEQATAELAAEGLTNREIAARLFVSQKTVEANLARAYRKLGIRSRAQLGARLARGPANT